MLKETDPEFAAIKERLIYGEIYTETKLDDKLRELVILVVASTNQTMSEIRRHTQAAIHCGVALEKIKEAVYHCAPYIGFGKAEAAVEERNSILAKVDEKKYIRVFREQEKDYVWESITPIICEGDVVGAVILLSSDEKEKFTKLEQKLGACAAGFLGKQME